LRREKLVSIGTEFTVGAVYYSDRLLDAAGRPRCIVTNHASEGLLTIPILGHHLARVEPSIQSGAEQIALFGAAQLRMTSLMPELGVGRIETSAERTIQDVHLSAILDRLKVLRWYADGQISRSDRVSGKGIRFVSAEVPGGQARAELVAVLGVGYTN
jgi:hypothetical protein